MWTATFKDIDSSGLDEKVKVSVEFSNDRDGRVYYNFYQVLPDDLNNGNFNTVVQGQVDILNAKDSVNVQLQELVATNALVAVPMPKPLI